MRGRPGETQSARRRAPGKPGKVLRSAAPTRRANAARITAASTRPRSTSSSLIRSTLLRSERSHVDAETVLHVRLHQSLIGLVDLLDGNHFDIGRNIMRAAEIEHLLGLRDAADI